MSRKKKTQRSLEAWTKQKWRTKSGKKSSETGERYLPEKAIKALSSAEASSTQGSLKKLLRKLEDIEALHNMENTLQKHPILGIISSIGVFILPYIEMLSPIIQFFGMIIGVLIGIFTLLIKIKEWKNNG